MLRVILAAALTCAVFAQPSQAGLFDLFNPLRNAVSAVGRAVEPEPESWFPAFERPLKVYPPYKPDGSPNDGSFYTEIRKQYFASKDTSQWLAKTFGCVSTSVPFFIDGAVMRTDRPPYNWIIVCQGVAVDAGLVAWWFTQRQPGNEDYETGYWPSYAETKTRMNGGKQIGRRYIDDTIRSSSY